MLLMGLGTTTIRQTDSWTDFTDCPFVPQFMLNASKVFHYPLFSSFTPVKYEIAQQSVIVFKFKWKYFI